MQTTTIAQALHAAAASGLARLDAQLLLLQALGRAATDRAWLLAHDSDALAPPAQQAFADLCGRRLRGEPQAYIAGYKEFFGLTLQVDPRVLVPRPDTETLVDWALALPGLPADARVVDLGTGSGAIALALKHARPRWQLGAVDLSADALAVARANADRLGLGIEFQQGRWMDRLAGGYHLIVSNPPYIAEGDPHLDALGHEPRSALTAGPDGLDDLRSIVTQAPPQLQPGGWLLLEHGHDQAHAVRALLRSGGFVAVDSRDDLAGITRCSGGQWPGQG